MFKCACIYEWNTDEEMNNTVIENAVLVTIVMYLECFIGLYNGKCEGNRYVVICRLLGLSVLHLSS